MSLQIAIVALIQSSVVIALALIVCRLWRRNPYARLMLCRTALVAAVGVIVASPWLHSRPRPVVPVDVSHWNFALTDQASAPTAKPQMTALQKVHRFLPTFAAAAAKAHPPVANPPVDLTRLARTVWFGGLFIAIGAFLVGIRRLAGIRSRTEQVAEGLATEVVRRVCEDFYVAEPKVLSGPSVESPFVAGFWKPTLYLPPAWLDIADTEVFEAICRHEIAHLSSQDLRWSFFHRVCSALLWPQPLLIALSREAAVAGEELCDQRVLSSGCSPQKYAGSLIRIKESLSQRGSIVSIGIGAVSVRSAFGRRIKSIMETEKLRSSLNRSRKAALFVGCLAATIGTTMLIAAPSWRGTAAAAKYQNPFAPMTGHAIVKILTRDGKLAAGHAELVLNDSSRITKVVDVPMANGQIDADLSQYKGFNRAILVVQSPGYAISFKRIWPTEQPVRELQLGEPTTLKGRLLLPDGTPAAGATVYVENLNIMGPIDPTTHEPKYYQYLMPAGDIRSTLSARTGQDGRFELPGLPQGFKVRVEAADPRFAVAATEANKVELAAAPETIGKDIQLHPGAGITGRVTQNGKPVPGILVAAQQQNNAPPDFEGGWGEAVTDSNGVYRIHKLIATSYNVSPDLDNTPLESQVTAVAHEGVAVLAGQTKFNVDIDLIKGGTVEGTVIRGDGSPAAGIQIGCYGPAHPNSSAWVQYAFADKNGHYSMRVPAGNQRVYVMEMTTPGGPPDDKHAVVRDGESTRVDLSAG